MPIPFNLTTIKHPNTFSLSSGETLLNSKVESIDQSIRLILTTSRGELFGDPDFGCRLQEYLFDQIGEDLSQAVKIEIAGVLNRYDSRIMVSPSDISISNEECTVKILIRYRVKYTDYTRTFSYEVPSEEDIINGNS